MSTRFSLEQIRDFWTEQALKHGQSPAASWSDQMVIEMEIREILKHLSDDDRVLDVGCANGYSTVQFAFHKSIAIRGLDYIPEMIEQARSRVAGLETGLRGTVEFGVGDITALCEPEAAFDKVVVIRVLINLSEWSRQVKALRECARVLKAGGTLLLSEATIQGWQRLNKFRREWGLTDIPMPPFNQYLDQEQVVSAAPTELELVEISDFASTYYVGTRVLKPLLIQGLKSASDPADPAAEWNRWCSQLPAWGDYGTQKLFVFRRT
jgi:ubiquinone/menaquinone biosynthesis C-methylase UbiE